MKKHNCYKVCRLDGKRFMSCIKHGRAAREYRVGSFTKALSGMGLLAFSSLREARGFFFRKSKSFVIFQAVGKEQMDLHEFSEFEDIESIRAAWAESWESPLWPRGTVAYARIKLLRKVST